MVIFYIRSALVLGPNQLQLLSELELEVFGGITVGELSVASKCVLHFITFLDLLNLGLLDVVRGVNGWSKFTLTVLVMDLSISSSFKSNHVCVFHAAINTCAKAYP